jgi:hypothetical protein
MSKEPPSRVAVNKPGDRIVLDPSIPQPENVFDLLPYKDSLKQAKQLQCDSDRSGVVGVYP